MRWSDCGRLATNRPNTANNLLRPAFCRGPLLGILMCHDVHCGAFAAGRDKLRWLVTVIDRLQLDFLRGQ